MLLPIEYVILAGLLCLIVNEKDENHKISYLYEHTTDDKITRMI
jgi:hypothetical protein